MNEGLDTLVLFFDGNIELEPCSKGQCLSDCKLFKKDIVLHNVDCATAEQFCGEGQLIVNEAFTC